MTPKQREQFNRMRATLRRIARVYQSPEQLRGGAGRQYGLSGSEAIEMAYANIQADAWAAVAGVKAIPGAERGAEEDKDRMQRGEILPGGELCCAVRVD